MCGRLGGSLSGGQLSFTTNQLGKHHQSLGSRPNVVSWVAGDQRQCGVGRGFDHAYIFRHYDLLSRNLVLVHLACAPDQNVITFAKFIDMTEKRIAMRGNNSISSFSRAALSSSCAPDRQKVRGVKRLPPQWRPG